MANEQRQLPNLQCKRRRLRRCIYPALTHNYRPPPSLTLFCSSASQTLLPAVITMTTPDFRAGAHAYFTSIAPARWDFSAFAQHCYNLPSFPQGVGVRKALSRTLWDSCLQELSGDCPRAEAEEVLPPGTLSVSIPAPWMGIHYPCMKGIILPYTGCLNNHISGGEIPYL